MLTELFNDLINAVHKTQGVKKIKYLRCEICNKPLKKSEMYYYLCDKCDNIQDMENERIHDEGINV